MIKALVGIGIVVLVLIVAALVAPFFIPVERYRGLIEAQVEKSTGRTFAIKGPMTFALLPRVKIELNDVSLGNAPGGQAAQMASIKRLDLGVALWPLLHKRVEADKLILIQPRIALEVDKAGKANWQFAEKAGTAPKTTEKTTADKSGSSVTFRFDGLELHDGGISYLDRRTGKSYRADKINVTADFSDLDSPATVKGNLLYRDRRVDIAMNAGKPSAFLSGGASPVAVKLTSEPVKVHFDGTVEGGKTVQATGDFKAEVPSVDALSAWLAPPAPDSKPLPVRAITLATHVVAGPDRAKLTGLAVNADSLDARGTLELNWAGKRPRLTGQLTTGMIDHAAYMPASGSDRAKSAAPSGGGDQGWSDKPIDLSALRTADINLKIETAGIKGNGFTIGAATLTVALDNGKLDANVPNVALFGGAADARVHVDASAAVPSFGLEAHARDVQAQPLLTTFANYTRLKGTMRGSAALTARGGSQKAIVEHLNGTVSGGLFNGAIQGLDLTAVLQKASSIGLGRSGDSSQQTSFTEMSSSFVVTNGTAHTEDMKLNTPALRLAGKGDVIIPEKRVAMRFQPEPTGAVKGAAALGGKVGGAVGGLMSVPFLVTGPWSHPSLKPDVTGVLEGGIKNQLQERLGIGGKSGSDKSGSDKSGGGALGGIKKLFGR
jgi:AsmA protein